MKWISTVVILSFACSAIGGKLNFPPRNANKDTDGCMYISLTCANKDIDCSDEKIAFCCPTSCSDDEQRSLIEEEKQNEVEASLDLLKKDLTEEGKLLVDNVYKM